SPPEGVVIFGPAGGESARRQMSGEKRVPDAEAPERILESGRLAGKEDSSLEGAFGRKDLARSAESGRIAHPQSRALLEKVDGRGKVALLAEKIGEEAGGDGSESSADEKVGVALGSEIVGEDAEDAVGHRRFEDVADGDGGTPPGSVRDDGGLVSGAGAVSQP